MLRNVVPTTVAGNHLSSHLTVDLKSCKATESKNHRIVVVALTMRKITVNQDRQHQSIDLKQMLKHTYTSHLLHLYAMCPDILLLELKRDTRHICFR